jgi:hypothetical protein
MKYTLALSTLTALALSASAALAQPAAGFSPEERLEGIRAGLVQAALQGTTRVDSVAWIDGQGVLREGSSFRSGMQVRGVQVLGYVRDSNGRPQAQIKLPTARASLLDHSAEEPVCAKPASLRHVIGLQLAVDGQWDSLQAPMAHALGKFGRSLWLQAGSSATGWRMLTQYSDKISQYEQLLTGAGEQPTPWRAVLSVTPPGAEPATDAKTPGSRMDWPAWWRENSLWGDAPTLVRLHFSLLPQGQGSPVFEASTDISIPAQASNGGPVQLPASVREQVARQVRQWTQALTEQLACVSVKPEVVHVRGADLRINVGALAGVRAGDEWLLADQRRFPQQILEPGVAAQAVLARVQRVDAHHAQLQVLAGPAEQIRTHWRAWQPNALTMADARR